MAYEDLLKDTSESFEDGNYFVLTIEDLDPGIVYPIQFRWKYKDGLYGKDWSATYDIIIPSEQVPGAPGVTANGDTPGMITLTWDGENVQGANIEEKIKQVDIYISGSPFDGSKPALSFDKAGTKTVAAPAGVYTIVAYAITARNLSSTQTTIANVTVSSLEPPVDPPTNPNGFSSRRILAGIEVSWAGTYSNGTFSGFEAIKVYAGTSATATNGTYIEVGVLTGNNVKNTIVVPVDGTYVKYGQATYIHAAAVNSNNAVGTIQANVTNQPLGPGKATDADINDGAVVISKLASDVLTVGNLKAGDINSTSYIRAGTAGSARVEISSSTVGSVLPGLTVYGSDGTTQLLRAPLTGGLTINGSGTFTGDLSAGTGESVFKSDSNGIYLGASTFAGAISKFRVSRTGVMNAASGTIGGLTLASDSISNALGTFKIGSTGQLLLGSESGTNKNLLLTPTQIVHRTGSTASGNFTLDIATGTLTLSGYATTAALNAKSKTYYQAAEPSSGMITGDIWIDENDNYKVYIYTGSAWQLSQDAVAAQATATAAANKSQKFDTVGNVNTGLTLNNTGSIYSDKSSYEDTTTGWYLGWRDIGTQQVPLLTPALNIGGASSYLRWTGNGIEVKGNISGSTGTFNGDVSISGTYTDLNQVIRTRTTSISSSTGIISINDTGADLLSGGGISISAAGGSGTYSATALSFTRSTSTGGITMDPGNLTIKAGAASSITITADDGQNRAIYPIQINGHLNVLYNIFANGSATFGSSGSQFEFLASTGNVRVAQTYSNVVSAGPPRAMYVNSNGLYGYVSSTIRHKENIQDHIVNEDALMSLDLKSFSYKNDEEKTVHYGFIAEQAESLGLNEIIQLNSEGLPEYFDYSRLSVFLFQVVKNQKDKIENLEQRLDALEG